jgi:hypothetical protein
LSRSPQLALVGGASSDSIFGDGGGSDDLGSAVLPVLLASAGPAAVEVALIALRPPGGGGDGSGGMGGGPSPAPSHDLRSAFAAAAAAAAVAAADGGDLSTPRPPAGGSGSAQTLSRRSSGASRAAAALPGHGPHHHASPLAAAALELAAAELMLSLPLPEGVAAVTQLVEAAPAGAVAVLMRAAAAAASSSPPSASGSEEDEGVGGGASLSLSSAETVLLALVRLEPSAMAHAGDEPLPPPRDAWLAWRLRVSWGETRSGGQDDHDDDANDGAVAGLRVELLRADGPVPLMADVVAGEQQQARQQVGPAARVTAVHCPSASSPFVMTGDSAGDVAFWLLPPPTDGSAAAATAIAPAPAALLQRCSARAAPGAPELGGYAAAVALCPSAGYAAAAITCGATEMDDALVVWSAEGGVGIGGEGEGDGAAASANNNTNSGGLFRLDSVIPLDDTPTAVAWLNVAGLPPLLAVGHAGGGVEMLARLRGDGGGGVGGAGAGAGAGGWRTLAVCSAPAGLPVVMLAQSSRGLPVVMAGNQLALLSNVVQLPEEEEEDEEEEEEGGGRVERRRPQQQQQRPRLTTLAALAARSSGSLPLYHPTVLSALLSRGRLGAASLVLRRLLAWVEAVDKGAEEEDEDEEEEAEEGSKAAAAAAQQGPAAAASTTTAADVPAVRGAKKRRAFLLELGDVVLPGSSKQRQDAAAGGAAAGAAAPSSSTDADVGAARWAGLAAALRFRAAALDVLRGRAPPARTSLQQRSQAVAAAAAAASSSSAAPDAGGPLKPLGLSAILARTADTAAKPPLPPKPAAPAPAPVAPIDTGMLDMSAFGGDFFGGAGGGGGGAGDDEEEQGAAPAAATLRPSASDAASTTGTSVQPPAAAAIETGALDMGAFGFATEPEPPPEEQDEAPRPPSPPKPAAPAAALASASSTSALRPAPPSSKELDSGMLDMSAFGFGGGGAPEEEEEEVQQQQEPPPPADATAAGQEEPQQSDDADNEPPPTSLDLASAHFPAALASTSSSSIPLATTATTTTAPSPAAVAAAAAAGPPLLALQLISDEEVEALHRALGVPMSMHDPAHGVEDDHERRHGGAGLLGSGGGGGLFSSSSSKKQEAKDKGRPLGNPRVLHALGLSYDQACELARLAVALSRRTFAAAGAGGAAAGGAGASGGAAASLFASSGGGAGYASLASPLASTDEDTAASAALERLDPAGRMLVASARLAVLRAAEGASGGGHRSALGGAAAGDPELHGSRLLEETVKRMFRPVSVSRVAARRGRLWEGGGTLDEEAAEPGEGGAVPRARPDTSAGGGGADSEVGGPTSSAGGAPRNPSPLGRPGSAFGGGGSGVSPFAGRASPSSSRDPAPASASAALSMLGARRPGGGAFGAARRIRSSVSVASMLSFSSLEGSTGGGGRAAGGASSSSRGVLGSVDDDACGGAGARDPGRARLAGAASWTAALGIFPGLDSLHLLWALASASPQGALLEALLPLVPAASEGGGSAAAAAAAHLAGAASSAAAHDPCLGGGSTSASSAFASASSGAAAGGGVGSSSRTPAAQAAAAPTWPRLRAVGAGLWLTDPAAASAAAEALARAQYARRRDPHDCALMYVASGRRGLLQGLFRTAGHRKVADFLARDFSPGGEGRAAASKNAFQLLAQHRHALAAAFFALAGCPEDAVGVLAREARDPQLALFVARLLEHSGVGAATATVSAAVPAAVAGVSAAAAAGPSAAASPSAFVPGPLQRLVVERHLLPLAEADALSDPAAVAVAEWLRSGPAPALARLLAGQADRLLADLPRATQRGRREEGEQQQRAGEATTTAAAAVDAASAAASAAALAQPALLDWVLAAGLPLLAGRATRGALLSALRGMALRAARGAEAAGLPVLAAEALAAADALTVAAQQQQEAAAVTTTTATNAQLSLALSRMWRARLVASALALRLPLHHNDDGNNGANANANANADAAPPSPWAPARAWRAYVRARSPELRRLGLEADVRAAAPLLQAHARALAPVLSLRGPHAPCSPSPALVAATTAAAEEGDDGGARVPARLRARRRSSGLSLSPPPPVHRATRSGGLRRAANPTDALAPAWDVADGTTTAERGLGGSGGGNVRAVVACAGAGFVLAPGGAGGRGGAVAAAASSSVMAAVSRRRPLAYTAGRLGLVVGELASPAGAGGEGAAAAANAAAAPTTTTDDDGSASAIASARASLEIPSMSGPSQDLATSPTAAAASSSMLAGLVQQMLDSVRWPSAGGVGGAGASASSAAEAGGGGGASSSLLMGVPAEFGLGHHHHHHPSPPRTPASAALHHQQHQQQQQQQAAHQARSSGGTVLLSQVAALSAAAHPTRPLFLAGAAAGLIYAWQYGDPRSRAAYAPVTAAAAAQLRQQYPPSQLHHPLQRGLLPGSVGGMSISLGHAHAVAAAAAAPHWGGAVSLRFARSGARFGAVGAGGLAGLWRHDAVSAADGLGHAEWLAIASPRGASDLQLVGDTGSQLLVAGAGSPDGLVSSGGALALWDTLAPPMSARAAELRLPAAAPTRLAGADGGGMGTGPPLVIVGDALGGLVAYDLRKLGGGGNGVGGWAGGAAPAPSQQQPVPVWSVRPHDQQRFLGSGHASSTSSRPGPPITALASFWELSAGGPAVAAALAAPAVVSAVAGGSGSSVPLGRLLVSGARDGSLAVVDARDGSVLQVVPMAHWSVRRGGLGALLAGLRGGGAGGGATAAATSEPLPAYRPPPPQDAVGAQINGFAVTPDGVLSCGADGAVRFHPLASSAVFGR